MEKQDKKIICKDCGKEFIFTVVNKNFIKKKVLLMNLLDVKNAVKLKKLVWMKNKSNYFCFVFVINSSFSLVIENIKLYLFSKVILISLLVLIFIELLSILSMLYKSSSLLLSYIFKLYIVSFNSKL